jgi:hypothetical protein
MRKGDYQIMDVGMRGIRFSIYQMEARQVLRFLRTLATEDQVQAFVQEHHLTLFETTTHGTWPVRNYTRRGRGRTSR